MHGKFRKSILEKDTHDRWNVYPRELFSLVPDKDKRVAGEDLGVFLRGIDWD
jgi:hypothetical protein